MSLTDRDWNAVIDGYDEQNRELVRLPPAEEITEGAPVVVTPPVGPIAKATVTEIDGEDVTVEYDSGKSRTVPITLVGTDGPVYLLPRQGRSHSA
jgi:hypothetical protein